ncbi:Flavin reductase like domain protein [Phycisphaerae bacterium RAS1]|nr:Flavin reductase like domain protein [Phycisphaerae bacterium RAS1]
MFVDVKSGAMPWRDVYKLCISFINPRPIALVSTLAADGRRNLAPFSFYNMVCARPPTVIVCTGVRRDGRPKDTLINIQETRQFVVATVTPAIARPMAATAAELPYGEDEFAFSGLTPAAASLVRPGLVKESPINIECGLQQIVSLGDGPGGAQVIFGDILAIHVDDGLLHDGQCDPNRLRTVGRLGGKWYADAANPYEMDIPEAPRR